MGPTLVPGGRQDLFTKLRGVISCRVEDLLGIATGLSNDLISLLLEINEIEDFNRG